MTDEDNDLDEKRFTTDDSTNEKQREPTNRKWLSACKDTTLLLKDGDTPYVRFSVSKYPLAVYSDYFGKLFADNPRKHTYTITLVPPVPNTSAVCTHTKKALRIIFKVLHVIAGEFSFLAGHETQRSILIHKGKWDLHRVELWREILRLTDQWMMDWKHHTAYFLRDGDTQKALSFMEQNGIMQGFGVLRITPLKLLNLTFSLETLATFARVFGRVKWTIPTFPEELIVILHAHRARFGEEAITAFLRKASFRGTQVMSEVLAAYGFKANVVPASSGLRQIAAEFWLEGIPFVSHEEKDELVVDLNRSYPTLEFRCSLVERHPNARRPAGKVTVGPWTLPAGTKHIMLYEVATAAAEDDVDEVDEE